MFLRTDRTIPIVTVKSLWLASLVLLLTLAALPAVADGTVLEPEAQEESASSTGELDAELSSVEDRSTLVGQKLARLLGFDETGGGASSDGDSKLQVHGFLTQAYADADYVDCPPGFACGPTETELNVGIPEGGTWNYRNMALQFRYDISERDIMVVQLSSRLLGQSPIGDLEDDVELDWAFYERRLGSSTSVKVGRVQIPLGIYNEIRDVGTILPFYRPPFGFYQEGSFTSETVDGIAFNHTFNPDGDWSLEANLYAGQWEILELAPDLSAAAFAKAEDAYGFWLWLDTPISGLRFGIGGNDKELKEGIFTAPDGTREGRLEEWDASIDATFSKVIFRSEYRLFEPKLNLPFGTINLTLETFYAQLGFPITDQFSIWLQGDYQFVKQESDVLTSTADFTLREDIGISFKYDFTPGLVIKAEYHETFEERNQLSPVFIPPGPLRFQNNIVGLDNGSYTILSLSVSF